MSVPLDRWDGLERSQEIKLAARCGSYSTQTRFLRQFRTFAREIGSVQIPSCGVVRVSSGWCVGGLSGLQKLSRGFLRLVALPPMLLPPGLLYPGLPQSSLSPLTPYSFPYYKSVLPQRFGSTVGAAISLFLPVGVYPTVSSL